MNRFTIGLICITAVSFSCTSYKPSPAETANVNVIVQQSNTDVSDVNDINKSTPRLHEPVSPDSELAQCRDVYLEGKTLIPQLTYQFDHSPFEKACFVTFGDTAEMMIKHGQPSGVTFHIFQNGQEVFEFPDVFDGNKACWAEAVAFDDLNDDGRTDIIMKGRCQVVKKTYPANAVFANTGTSFKTNLHEDNKLEKLNSIEKIKAYVKKDPEPFFRSGV